MIYVDVILPLPLDGFFTYGVPETLVSQVSFGIRVVVPFGRSKTYTALVARTHEEKPEFKVKPIIEVLDQEPILLPKQYELWQWMSSYYMAPMGEVYRAALPSGLKNEDGYRPKTEKCLALSQELRSEEALRATVEGLHRSKVQQQAFIDFLELTGWATLQGTQPAGPISELSQDELVNHSHCKTTTIKALTDKKILRSYERETGRLTHSGEYHPERIKPLSRAQEEAFNAIQKAWLTQEVVLLHGVTSSGKTEIYKHLIQKTLDEGKQVLYLLPEIALTVQITQRLQEVFGHRLGIYHSKYSDAERVEIWKKQLSKRPYDIILGARSAVFVPMQRLGLIIVDEEHEPSFKQQDPMPRYHARATALMLARLCGAKTLLGTATPSAESLFHAQNGKYGLVRLTQRYKDVQLPKIQVIDTKDLQRRKMMHGIFSPQLLEEIDKTLRAGKQAILFLNRRGYTPAITCQQCGWVPRCTHCDVALTFHRSQGQMVCHYCGRAYCLPTHCPQCGSHELRGKGVGTERIEDQVQTLLPHARIARMDLDTTRSRRAYERIINDFSTGRTNLLIGTQMVSKGLDFANVRVVGILDADMMLNMPDFRAYEYAFMLMSQVSGRAGRKDGSGLVLLQTKSKDLPVVKQMAIGDTAGFYTSLFEERQMFHYPPFHRLIYIYLRHRNDRLTDSAAMTLGNLLVKQLGSRILGPDKPAVAMVNDHSIRKIVVKIENTLSPSRVKEILRSAEASLMSNRRYATLQIYYDVDPT